MGGKNEEDLVRRIAKGVKWGGMGLFFVANLFLAYQFSTAFEKGQRRAEILHKER